MYDDEDIKPRELGLWDALLDDEDSAQHRPEHQHGVSRRAHAGVCSGLGTLMTAIF